jgi:hypothetical protein
MSNPCKFSGMTVDLGPTWLGPRRLQLVLPNENVLFVGFVTNGVFHVFPLKAIG